MAMRRVLIIGGGHNGLTCAAYLARAGADVTLLERRPVFGGACVTEEMWPGYRVSRAAYVLSLFRPAIIRELALERHGLALIPRAPSSATPLPDGRSLVLGANGRANVEEIARFSRRDAEAYPRYEARLARIAAALEPTLDAPPPTLAIRHPRDLRPWWLAMRAAVRLGRELPQAARLMLGAARDLLEEWFDSEPLRATLATDAIIGAFAAPSTPGTGYVLFHHVMGSVTGQRGVWAYVRGGMGALSDALAAAATTAGARLRSDAEVARLHVRDGRAVAVELQSGESLAADAVVSAIDPARTFALVGDRDQIPEDFSRALAGLDFRSPVVKLNLALRELPRFRVTDRDALPLSGTIHLGSENLDAIELAYAQALRGEVSERPIVELTIPSTLDPTLAPPGRHVASVFAQYAPALAMNDPAWSGLRDRLAERVLALIEEAAPGFRDSVEEIEVLAPPDLERVFGLTGGNIFHGAMTPDRLLLLRPLPDWANYRTPITGLYLCGSGTHPGGGVMGASGRNAAFEIARDLRSSGGQRKGPPDR